MSVWLLPRNELSNEQIRAIEMPMNTHRVILGPPGSGKTQILLHRARHLIDAYNISRKRLHIFVFTNTLKFYIKSALELLDLPLNCVTTFDSWCYSNYLRYISPNLPIREGENCPDFAAIRKAVSESIQGNNIKNIYDAVLVDEGQDLDTHAFSLFTKIAKHITVCMDYKQQIFDTGMNEQEILDKLGLRRSNISLLEAYRCCPYIASLAAELIDDQMEKTQYLNQVRIPQAEKELPLLYIAKDYADELERLKSILKIRLTKGEKIGVIILRNSMIDELKTLLQKEGFPVESGKDIDFSGNRIKILSYHSVKGLSFDTVLMPFLYEKSFTEKVPDIEYQKRLLFVAVTRAVKWAYMSSASGDELKLLDLLIPLEKEKKLTAQRCKDINISAQNSGNNNDTKNNASADSLDFL
ncbi:UvrD-helicase domain-containing protein [Candidatus Dependentiae bacterium]|nr:UvrD-helicase domain-containing protein [Candidatus Dependentiae bacterium]